MLLVRTRWIARRAALVLTAALVVASPRSTQADSLGLEVDPASRGTLAPNQATTIDIVYVDKTTSNDQLVNYDAYFTYDPSKLVLGPFVNGPALSGSDFQSSPLFNDNSGTVTESNFATTGISVTAGNSYILAQFTVTATSAFTAGKTVLNLLPTDAIGSTDLWFASGLIIDSSTSNGNTTLFDVPVTSGTNDPGDVTLSAASVPEPASLLAFGFGLCGVAIVASRTTGRRPA